MKNIKDLRIYHYPDGHLHACLEEKDLGLTEIALSIKSFDDLFLLAQLKQICSNLSKVRINYLLTARCDRQFSIGEAVDLEIVASFINKMGFKEVEILKPHSKVSLELINNSKKITVTSELLIKCLEENKITDYSIISPDKGASQWITEELGRTDVVQCNKIRENGVVKSVTFDGEVKEVSIILDDLIDGGKTFTELSKELKAKGSKEVYLIVTHGIFSQGFSELEKHLTKIYCTNSFQDKDDIFINYGDITSIRQNKFVDERLNFMNIW